MIRTGNCAKRKPLKHAWRRCICVGRAAELLRADLQEQLKFLQHSIGFQHIRFHASFHDELGVVHRTKDGRIEYRWSELDKVYDALVALGFDPIVELNPMPKALARDPEAVMFWYAMNPSPPAEFREWEAFIRAFIEHLAERYGLQRLQRWSFEVWNEPNLKGFWHGTQAEYFELYACCARAIKSLDRSLKVGGPAGAGSGWNLALLDFCRTEGVALDFISFHGYPAGEYCAYPRREGSPHRPGYAFIDDFETAQKALLERGAGELPIIVTEWNTNTCDENGQPLWVGSMQCSDLFSGAAACHYAVHTDPFVDIFGYWAASDVFFESGPHLEAYGGDNQYYGILTIHGYPKPIFHAFKFLSRMEGPRYELEGLRPPATGDALCVASHGVTRALLWNFHMPEQSPQTWQDEISLCVPERLQASTAVRVVVAKIEAGQGSAFEAWQAMGRPANLTRTEQEALKARSEPNYDFVLADVKDGRVTLPFELRANEVLYLEVGAEVSVDAARQASIDLGGMNRLLNYS